MLPFRLCLSLTLLSLTVNGGEIDESSNGQHVVRLPYFAQEFLGSLVQITHSKHVNLFTEGNANAYVDRLFTGLKDFLAKKFDPLIKEEVAPEVKKIYVEGLSTIVRTGAATVRAEGDQSIFSARLGFHRFKGNADFEKHLWWVFWISGTANIHVTGLDFYFQIRTKFVDDKIKLRLESLSIHDWGHLDTSLSGSNWIGSMASFVTNLFPSIVSKWIKNNIPSLLFNGINDALKDVSFSLSDVDLSITG